MMNRAGARSLGIVPPNARRNEEVVGTLARSPDAARFSADEVATADILWRDEIFTIADLEIFETLAFNGNPAVILGAGLFIQRDFIIDFVRSRLLVKIAMEEADQTEPANQEGAPNSF